MTNFLKKRHFKRDVTDLIIYLENLKNFVGNITGLAGFMCLVGLDLNKVFDHKQKQL